MAITLSKRRKFGLGLAGVLLIGLLLPQNLMLPVKGADARSYHPRSFWYYPWGKSGTHKGVDIFAKQGTPVQAATGGLVLYTGTAARGGNVVLVLGPKWRMHYYAHLETIKTARFAWLWRGEAVGTVGATGNAAGKPPHLHYTIASLLPYPWRWDEDLQGWKKMFYLDPTAYF